MRRGQRHILVIFLSLIVVATGLSGQDLENELARLLVFSRGNIGFGARAMAMGGAFTALADDITAISYNPAGLAQLMRVEISAGANLGGLTVKHPGATASNASWGAIQADPFTPRMAALEFDYFGMVAPFRIAGIPVVLGAAYQNRVSNRLKMDFERQVHYTESTVFPNRIGRDVENITINDRGGINTATFSFAIRPVEFLHIGTNVDLNRMNMTDSWSTTEEISYLDGDVEISNWSQTYDGTSVYKIDHGISYDIGALLKFDVVSLGVVYKKGWHGALTKSDRFERVRNDNGSVTTLEGSDEDIGELYWPDSISAGLSLRPAEAFTLSLEYQMTRWSKGRVDWDPLEEPLPSGFPVEDPEDTRQLRAGFEYLTFVKDIAIPFRVGGFKDRMIGRDDSGQAIDLWAVTFGTGFASKHAVLDIAAVYHFGSYLENPWFGDTIVSGVSASDKILNWRVLASLTFRPGK